MQVSQTSLILVCVNMSSVVVAGGAWVFSRHERWPYLDAVYYCVVTLTTIGFGDYVALQRSDDDAQRRPEYFVFSLVFILVGLAVLSAATNLLVLRFLTMNTDDERKDELEAFAAASQSVTRLDGDVVAAKARSSTAAAAAAAAALLRRRHGDQDGAAIEFVDDRVPDGDVVAAKARSPTAAAAAAAGLLRRRQHDGPTVDFVDDRAPSACSCTCYDFRSDAGGAPRRWLRRLGVGRRRTRQPGYSAAAESAGANGSVVGHLLQPVAVIPAVTQDHDEANQRDRKWLAAARTAVFGARRSSI